MLTGGCTEEELRAAGTDVVLRDLAEFPGWLDAHVLDVRLAALERRLRSRGSVLVAFSGGADSAFLLAAAVRALGAGARGAPPRRTPTRCRRPSGRRPGRSPRPRGAGADAAHARDGARGLPRQRRRPLLLLQGRAARRARPAGRREHGLAHVATGTNADDAVAGFRPGIRAAAERGAVTPLRDAGLTKEQVRAASRRWGLPTWDKPAAACLSSRVAYGIEVTPVPARPGSSGPRPAVRAALAAAGVEVRDLRVRDLGDRASLEVDAAPGRGGRRPTRRCSTALRDAGFDAGRGRPAGLPLRRDERAAGRRRTGSAESAWRSG